MDGRGDREQSHSQGASWEESPGVVQKLVFFQGAWEQRKPQGLVWRGAGKTGVRAHPSVSTAMVVWAGSLRESWDSVGECELREAGWA